MTNTSDTPIEAFERTYPMKVLRYRLRQGSGGAGRFRGGDGTERVIQMLEPATLSLVTERRSSRPWGLSGGEPGSAGENWLWPAGDATAARRRKPHSQTVGRLVKPATPQVRCIGGLGGATGKVQAWCPYERS